MDFDKLILDQKGQPIYQGVDQVSLDGLLKALFDEDEDVTAEDRVKMCRAILTGKKDALTFGTVACNALLSNPPDDKADGDEKAKRFKLAMRASEGGEQAWKPSEITLMEKMVAKVYGTLIVGRVDQIINPVAEESASDKAA